MQRREPRTARPSRRDRLAVRDAPAHDACAGGRRTGSRISRVLSPPRCGGGQGWRYAVHAVARTTPVFQAASRFSGRDPAAAGSRDTARTPPRRPTTRASAIALTWKIERVYSPVADAAVAIGRNPATVTSVPESIGIAVLVVGEARRAQAVPPLLHLRRHHLDRDDRVVDEEAEREDQRAERDLVQSDVADAHEEEGRGEDERDRERDDDAGPQAEREEAHREHDEHRFGQRAHELVHRALHRLRLARHLRELQADRQVAPQALDLAVEVRAELDDVAALRHRDADAERLAAQEAHLRLRRVGVAALHACDVADAEQPPIGADRRLADRLDRIEVAGGAEEDLVARRLERARRVRSRSEWRARRRSSERRRRASRAWCSRAR